MSKTLAEKAAWDFAEKQGLQLAVLNPVLVLGPTLTPSITGSLQVFLQIMKGQSSTTVISFQLIYDLSFLLFLLR